MADVSPLSAQLSHPEAAQRATAAEQLARLGNEARGAAVPLVRSVADLDESVREWAVGALEELGAPSPDDQAALVPLLEHDNSDVAYWAVTLLGRLGNDGAPAVPRIAAALEQSPHRAVRERAAWALGQLGIAAPEAVTALRGAASSAEPRLARMAQSALSRLGE